MKTREDMFAYQHRCVRFIKNRPSCALWVEMGLGKTVSTLTALDELMRDFEVQKVLVVAPLRVARKVWSDEVKEWAHLNHLRVSVICGTPKQREAAMRVEADIYTVNRENWAWLCQHFIVQENRRVRQIAKWPWDTLVLDEADSFKSQSSARWKWAKRVVKFKLVSRVIELTGTPASNGYQDVWSQVYLLDLGQRLYDNEDAFNHRWMEPPEFGTTKWQMKPGSDVQIAAAVKDIVISLQADDYLDLPPVMFNFIKVELSPPVRELYKQMEHEYMLEIVPDKVIMAVNGGVLYGKLLQMAGGAVYRTVDEKTREVFHLHNEKTAVLIETLEGLAGPIMVGYNFQHELDRIRVALDVWCKQNGKTYRLLKTKVDEDDWNAGKIDILILHPKSGGHGLNLQLSGSENIIWYGPTPDRGLFDQMNGRLAGGHRRKGRNIVIHQIIAEDTIDDLVVIPTLDFKGDNQARLMKLLSERVRQVL